MPRTLASPPSSPAPSAAPFVPERLSWRSLKEASATCRGCDLWKRGTQTVFGEGARMPPAIFIGEQPGHEEDLAGRPFIGPAGRLFDRALEAAGIERGDAYVTNVVKHFKWEPRGKRRLHAKPNALEIRACLPWLAAEVEVLKPKVLVCLGATAAQAVIGKSFRVTKQRGEVLPSTFGVPATATVHPSSILRAPDDETRRLEMERFVADLQGVRELLARELV